MQNVGQVTGKKRANVAAQNCKNKSSSVGGGGSGATASSISSSNKNPNVGAAQTAPPPRVNDSESEDESVSEVKSTPFLVGSPNLKRPSVGRSSTCGHHAFILSPSVDSPVFVACLFDCSGVSFVGRK